MTRNPYFFRPFAGIYCDNNLVNEMDDRLDVAFWGSSRVCTHGYVILMLFVNMLGDSYKLSLISIHGACLPKSPLYLPKAFMFSSSGAGRFLWFCDSVYVSPCVSVCVCCYVCEFLLFVSCVSGGKFLFFSQLNARFEPQFDGGKTFLGITSQLTHLT